MLAKIKTRSTLEWNRRMGPMRVLNNLRHAMSHKKRVNKFRKLAKVVKAKTRGINAATLIFDHQKDQEFWVFPPQADVNQLELLKEALLGAEPIRAELDRGTKVLLPNQAQKPISLPPDFFNVTQEELKREQELK